MLSDPYSDGDLYGLPWYTPVLYIQHGCDLLAIEFNQSFHKGHLKSSTGCSGRRGGDGRERRRVGTEGMRGERREGGKVEGREENERGGEGR